MKKLTFCSIVFLLAMLIVGCGPTWEREQVEVIQFEKPAEGGRTEFVQVLSQRIFRAQYEGGYDISFINEMVEEAGCGNEYFGAYRLADGSYLYLGEVQLEGTVDGFTQNVVLQMTPEGVIRLGNPKRFLNPMTREAYIQAALEEKYELPNLAVVTFPELTGLHTEVEVWCKQRFQYSPQYCCIGEIFFAYFNGLFQLLYLIISINHGFTNAGIAKELIVTKHDGNFALGVAAT